MRLVTVIIILLATINTSVIGREQPKCSLLKGIDKKLFYNAVPSVIHNNKKTIIFDGNGILHYYDEHLIKSGELHLFPKNTKITRNSFTSFFKSKAIDHVISVDNMIYAIKDKEDSGIIRWKEEFIAPVKNITEVSDTKLAVLTANNYVYILDITNGNLLWSDYNGAHDVRFGLYSVTALTTALPIFHSLNGNGILVVPFLNGELKAFNEDGKVLWVYKLPVNFISNPFTNITRLISGSITDTIIAANKLTIEAVNIKSGKLIWRKYLKAQNIISSTPLIIVTEDNKILGVNEYTGDIQFEKQLPVKDSKCNTLIPYNNKLFYITKKGIVVVLDSLSGNIMKVVNVPKGNYYHTLSSYNESIASFAFGTDSGIFLCGININESL